MLLYEAILEKSIDLESLSSKSPEIVCQELIKIKGIGHWTIDVYLMFSNALIFYHLVISLHNTP
jgi:DNA-3-methyladenine glycosylase II